MGLMWPTISFSSFPLSDFLIDEKEKKVNETHTYNIKHNIKHNIQAVE